MQAAREALTEKVFIKGPDYKNKFGFVFGDGLVTSDGEKHKGELHASTGNRLVLWMMFTCR